MSELPPKLEHNMENAMKTALRYVMFFNWLQAVWKRYLQKCLVSFAASVWNSIIVSFIS